MESNRKYKILLFLYILLSIFINIACFRFASFIIYICIFIFQVFTAVIMYLLYRIIISEVIEQAQMLEKTMDRMLNNCTLGYEQLLEDTLYSKLYTKLYKINEIQKLNVQEREDELAIIHELISDISHQVKTPIANIKVYSEMILKDEELSTNAICKLKTMESQVNKLDFLLKSLIKMSRLETNIIVIRPEKYKIIDLVAGALNDVVIDAEKKNITIATQCSHNVMAYIDLKWTIEAVFNILDNAVKYTPINGKILIEVEELEEFVKVGISDTGIGIEEKKIPLIFQRFYRDGSIKNIEGLGLGLCLAREIIEKEKGYIRVFSKVGKGTSFFVFLWKGKKSNA